MTLQKLIVLAQFVAALGVISSVVYLAIQVRQNAKITKAQFGHSLTSRLYERYFLAAKDQEFSRFLAKNCVAGSQYETRLNHRIIRK